MYTSDIYSKIFIKRLNIIIIKMKKIILINFFARLFILMLLQATANILRLSNQVRIDNDLMLKK